MRMPQFFETPSSKTDIDSAKLLFFRYNHHHTVLVVFGKRLNSVTIRRHTETGSINAIFLCQQTSHTFSTLTGILFIYSSISGSLIGISLYSSSCLGVLLQLEPERVRVVAEVQGEAPWVPSATSFQMYRSNRPYPRAASPYHH